MDRRVSDAPSTNPFAAADSTAVTDPIGIVYPDAGACGIVSTDGDSHSHADVPALRPIFSTTPDFYSHTDYRA